MDEAEIERQFQEEHGDAILEQDSKNEDILLLQRACMNEKGAPEILQYEENLVYSLKELIEHQQDNIDNVQPSLDLAFANVIYQMEVDRINFLLVDYHRTRLLKIQKHALYMLQNEELLARLSKKEEEFAKKYLDIVVTHQKEVVVDKLPRIFRKLADKSDGLNMVRTPCLDEYVYFRVDDEVGKVVFNEETGEEDTLTEGDIIAARYNPIAGLVKIGKAFII